MRVVVCVCVCVYVCLLPVQVVNNVGVLVFPHDQNLVYDQLLLRLLLQVHLLDGHLGERHMETERDM